LSEEDENIANAKSIVKLFNVTKAVLNVIISITLNLHLFQLLACNVLYAHIY